jgi:hypothetical protein
VLSAHIKGGRVPIVAVSGTRGVGKTTLVRTYSHAARDSGRFVFWFNAESRETIITGFLELAQHIFSCYWEKYRDSHPADETQKARARLRAELGFPDVDKLLQTRDFNSIEDIKVKAAVRAVKDWLLRDGNRWLLVYENVDGWTGQSRTSFDLMQFLPLTVQGQIILITHEQNRCPWSLSEFLVTGWTEDAAGELLIKLSHLENTPSNCKILHSPLPT